MNEFEEYLLNQNLSGRTVQLYNYYVEGFTGWCEDNNIEVTGVVYGDVMEYVEYLQQKEYSVRYINANLKAIEYYYRCLEANKAVTHIYITGNKPEKSVIGIPITGITIKGTKRNHIFEPLDLPEVIEVLELIPTSTLKEKLNKVLYSLLVFQALRTHEVLNLKRTDVDFTKGTIFITGTRKTNDRKLQMDSRQVILLYDYILQSDHLEYRGDCVIQFEGYDRNIHNLLHRLLKKINRFITIKNWQQVRATVISNWLLKYNLREVQYMCGHKFVSSTEKYQVNKVKQLERELVLYHPMRD